MRLVFMGTPDFAVTTLEALLAAGHEVVCAYSQPPRPAGRGMSERPSAVHAAAAAHGIEVRTPQSLSSAEEQQRFAGLAPEAAVVVAYGLLLPKPVLEAPQRGCFNVHASLLPRHRGSAPINWCVMMGEAVTGITTMYTDIGMDTGDMLLKAGDAFGLGIVVGAVGRGLRRCHGAVLVARCRRHEL